MAKASPTPLGAPAAAPAAAPEVTTAAAPEVVALVGPVIEYVGEGAELVEFVVNPLASKYVVNGNGVVLETF